MVDLWVFLDARNSKAKLYREFYGDDHRSKIDYRIFTGQIGTVDRGLEDFLRNKFADAGLDEQTVRGWIREMDGSAPDERVPYVKIRPLLAFLRDELHIPPAGILRQRQARYESGELRSVSKSIYDRALSLQRQAESIRPPGRAARLERLREAVCGEKQGYTLFSLVEADLRFLKVFARRSPTRYLGRSISAYEKGEIRRIATWRAERIRDDCDRWIRRHPELKLSALPASRRAARIRELLTRLLSYAVSRVLGHEGAELEKRVLKPALTRYEYGSRLHGLTDFERAPGSLGMRKAAFDLMVAENCSIFRAVGTYLDRWYISDLYLKELHRNELFELVSMRYEALAQGLARTGGIDSCLFREIARGHLRGPGPITRERRTLLQALR